MRENPRNPVDNRLGETPELDKGRRAFMKDGASLGIVAAAGGVLAGIPAGIALERTTRKIEEHKEGSGLRAELQKVVERLDPSGNVIKNALKNADNELVDASKKVEQLHDKASDTERSEEDIALLKIEAVLLGNYIAEVEIYRDMLQKRADEAGTPACILELEGR